MAAVADRTGLVVMEAFHYRYHPLAHRMRDAGGEGELGTLEHVETALCFPLPKFSDIRYQYDLGGGATMDVGSYTVHLARLLGLEEPTVTSATAKLRTPDVDRAMRAELAFPSGHTGRITCSMWSTRRAQDLRAGRGARGELHVINPTNPQMWHRMRVKVDGVTRTERFSRRPTYEFQLDAFTARGAARRADAHSPVGLDRQHAGDRRDLRRRGDAAARAPDRHEHDAVPRGIVALVAGALAFGCLLRLESQRATAHAPGTTTSAPGADDVRRRRRPRRRRSRRAPTRPTRSPGVDAALERRVADAGLSGGFLRIVADDGTVLHEHGIGGVSGVDPARPGLVQRSGSPRPRS